MRQMDNNTKRFDDQPTLPELIGDTAGKLACALTEMLGPDARLVDASGQLVLGCDAPTASAARIPVNWDLEPVGYLEVEPNRVPAARGAATLLERVIAAHARYLMAKDVHQEAARADYQVLLEKHAQLIASEARYRQLASDLDQQVKEQVRTIEQAQRSLFQSEKLAAVGSLAAGMAHEINNPIAFIKSNLATAAQYIRKLDELRASIGTDTAVAKTWAALDLDFVLQDFTALLNESLQGAERVASIVADLKGFSGTDQIGEAPTDVNACLQQVVNVSAPQVREAAQVVLSLEPVPLTRADASRLNQAFLNIVLNAAQAIDSHGTIHIATQQVDDKIVVRIADTGRGIPPEILPRIFDPFFTTREVGQGTGMGLSVAQDIIRAHGGEIEVTSQEGRGTIMTIRIPVAG